MGVDLFECLPSYYRYSSDAMARQWWKACLSVCQVITGTVQMQWLGSGGKLNSVLQKQWLNGWSQVERVGLFCSCICKYRWAPAGYGVGLAGGNGSAVEQQDAMELW
ncbi:uncharacterized protein LOC113301226 [Papaver somniferum]|uniref:uncharacterized protein LOC113301226 n=1 Tax=Papaver somniferum TaxID=3469 RepID=UPI000E6F75F6|nr:uncharacterized protein LOC113301226 [Papaver somniferum]